MCWLNHSRKNWRASVVRCPKVLLLRTLEKMEDYLKNKRLPGWEIRKTKVRCWNNKQFLTWWFSTVPTVLSGGVGRFGNCMGFGSRIPDGWLRFPKWIEFKRVMGEVRWYHASRCFVHRIHRFQMLLQALFLATAHLWFNHVLSIWIQKRTPPKQSPPWPVVHPASRSNSVTRNIQKY